MKVKTAFVWDVDETLGSFSSFARICDGYELYTKTTLTDKTFNSLISLFPELLRPNIVRTLRHLKRKMHKTDKMVVYTNNTGEDIWIDRILKHIELLAGIKLFDKIIRAYQVNKKQLRRSHDKTYEDLLRCLKTKKIDTVYFVDDQPHVMLSDDRVHGLHIPPYVNEFKLEHVVDTLIRAHGKGKGTLLLGVLDTFKLFETFRKVFKRKGYSNDFSNTVVYSKLDDKVLTNFVEQFIKKIKSGSQTRKA